MGLVDDRCEGKKNPLGLIANILFATEGLHICDSSDERDQDVEALLQTSS